MSKTDVVRKAMMDALKAGDKPRKEALSLLLAALKAKEHRQARRPDRGRGKRRGLPRDQGG